MANSIRALVGDAAGRQRVTTITQSGKVTEIREDFDNKAKRRISTDIGGDFGYSFAVSEVQAQRTSIGDVVKVEIEIRHQSNG